MKKAQTTNLARALLSTALMGGVAIAQNVNPPSPGDVFLRGDDLKIDRSCRVFVPPGVVVEDGDRDGVVHVIADDVVVTFVGDFIRGASPDRAPESFEGFAVRVQGRKNVRLQGLRARGFRAGVYATRADGLVVERADVSDNRAQRLRSTPTRCDDGADWLAPHDNDANEWLVRYGAGIYVEDSNSVEIRRTRVRRTQNGIVLDRVDHASVYDNDASFLSGWGLAMWRSSKNVVSRNAFDFCIRGYSHGVYNRGQDSAGILLFEQCRDNFFNFNSVTHGGDGLFGFAGNEAIGASGPPDMDRTRRGCDGNVFHGNDFSFAAAHGLELTFSFGNRVEANLFEGNAICGVWGGYSQDTTIVFNRFVNNGDAGYGLERGGVNIEHGAGNRVAHNSFDGDRCGVHLWGRGGGNFREKPWGRANPPKAAETVALNRFARTPVAIHLRGTDGVRLVDNRFDGCAEDGRFESAAPAPEGVFAPVVPWDEVVAPGDRSPVGARAAFRGRDKIVMTAYGPWDRETPVARLDLDSADGARHAWRVFGVDAPRVIPVYANAGDAPPAFVVRVGDGGATEGIPVEVASTTGGVVPYVFLVSTGGPTPPIRVSGLLIDATWNVRFFPWAADPRADEAAWRAGADAPGSVATTTRAIAFPFGGGGPSDVATDEAVRAAKLPSDRFGVLASTRLRLPKGRWRVTVVSDDGVRLKIDDKVAIDAWTWHPPRTDGADFAVEEERDVAFDLAYFEIDGHAVLDVSFERLD